MSIDVKHLAKLARLRIEDDKLEKFEKIGRASCRERV